MISRGASRQLQYHGVRSPSLSRQRRRPASVFAKQRRPTSQPEAQDPQGNEFADAASLLSAILGRVAGGSRPRGFAEEEPSRPAAPTAAPSHPPGRFAASLKGLVLEPTQAWRPPGIWESFLAEGAAEGMVPPDVDAKKQQLGSLILGMLLAQEIPLEEGECRRPLLVGISYLAHSLVGVDVSAEAVRASGYSAHRAVLRHPSDWIKVLYSRLAQLHLDWLACAAAHVGPSGSAEQAAAIAHHLAYHAERLADLAAEAKWTRTRYLDYPRALSELFLLAVAGTWLQAASAALASEELREELQDKAALWARYLICTSTVLPAERYKEMMSMGRLNGPTNYFTRPLSGDDESTFEENPFFQHPQSEEDAILLGTALSTVAVVPLTALCGGPDTPLSQWALVHLAELPSQPEPAEAEPESGGLTGLTTRLFGARQELMDGRATQAEGLLHESAALLQEPVLVTVMAGPTPWEELGGAALLDAAARTNAAEVVIALEQILADGPYAQAAPWRLTVLQCYLGAGRLEEVVELEALLQLGELVAGSIQALGALDSSEVPEPKVADAGFRWSARQLGTAATRVQARLARQLLAAVAKCERGWEDQQALAGRLGRRLLESRHAKVKDVVQALGSLDANNAGPVACFLTRLLLKRGAPATAWQLLQPSLAAACRSDASVALEIVGALYSTEHFTEVGDAWRVITKLDLPWFGLVWTREQQSLQRLAALSEAKRGRPIEALNLTADLGQEYVIEVVQEVLHTRSGLTVQVAERCMQLCSARRRADLVTAIYSRLDSAQLASLPLKSHVAALRACLALIEEGSGRSSSTTGSSSNSTSAANLALEILQRQAVALRFLSNVKLARALCNAACHAIRHIEVQPSRSAVVRSWVGAKKGADNHASSDGLPSAAQLALWGLKLSQEAGADQTELQAQLSAAVNAYTAPRTSGHLRAMLARLPDWVPGLQPSLADWGALLCAARRDAGSRSAVGEELDLSVAKVLRGICHNLRTHRGPGWVQKLPKLEAQMAVLLVGDALGDQAIIREAFNFVSYSRTPAKADAPLLNQVYNRLLLDTFFPVSSVPAVTPPSVLSSQPGQRPAAQQDFQWDRCIELVERWQSQLATVAEKPMPLTAGAAEALAAVRMVGLHELKPGCSSQKQPRHTPQKAPPAAALLEPLAEVGGRVAADLLADAPGPPSSASPQSEESPSRRVLVGSAAVPAPPDRFPPLDAELVIATLGLLMACHRATEECPGAGLGSSPLAAGVQALMHTLCAQQQPLTQLLGCQLLDALWCDNALLDWADGSFQLEGHSEGGLVAALEEFALQKEGLTPVLLQPRQGGPELKRLETRTASGEQADQAALIGVAGLAYTEAAKLREERLSDVRNATTMEDIKQHLLAYGWVAKHGKNRNMFWLPEAGLPASVPKQTVTLDLRQVQQQHPQSLTRGHVLCPLQSKWPEGC
ncbi:hypothetical protein N2152v2_008754 [Parachlorella kessleri]